MSTAGFVLCAMDSGHPISVILKAFHRKPISRIVHKIQRSSAAEAGSAKPSDRGVLRAFTRRSVQAVAP